jgi:hypothetical protein
MIQRIQSLYLLLVTVLLTVALFLPIGQFLAANGATYEFMNLHVNMPDGTIYSASWGLFALLIFSAIVSLANIFLFSNRMLQIRFSIFTAILLVGYYLCFLFFMFVLQEKLEATYHLKWSLALPLIALILDYLALRAIGKDEAMVRAADRLR